MSSTTTNEIVIEKIKTSRLKDVDFDNLVFGNVFTDHMFECDFIDGAWRNPTIKPYGNLSISPAAKVFHYGQAVFEGMKAYKDDNGKVFLFRPTDNFNRINISSKRMAIPEFPVDLLNDALHKIVAMDSDWIKPGLGNSLYIRPFAIATQVGVSASPSNQYKFMILLSPAQAYYTGDVRVVFAESFSRAADGGVGFAKAAGNYGAQFYPTNLAKEEGFQQIIWTDANEHKYLEEAGTMNIFFRINDTLVTSPTNDRILDGITRRSVIKIAEDKGFDVDVRQVPVAEIVEAAENGSLKEIFGSGTAATISPVSAFSYQKKIHELPKMESSYASKFKQILMDIQYNKSEDPYGWRIEVKK